MKAGKTGKFSNLFFSFALPLVDTNLSKQVSSDALSPPHSHTPSCTISQINSVFNGLKKDAKEVMVLKSLSVLFQKDT